MGYVNWISVFLTIWAIVYLAMLVVALRRQRIDRHPRFERLDINDPIVPESVRIFIPERITELTELGLDLVGCVIESQSALNYRAYHAVLVDEKRALAATATASVVSATARITRFRYFCMLSCDYSDGPLLQVSNALQLMPLPMPVSTQYVQLPGMTDLAGLRELHDALAREAGSTSPILPNMRDAVSACADNNERIHAPWIDSGYLHECDNGAMLRFSLRGAVRAVSSVAWPFKQIRYWQIRRRARCILRRYRLPANYAYTDYAQSLSGRSAPQPLATRGHTVIARPPARQQSQQGPEAKARYTIWGMHVPPPWAASLLFIAAVVSFVASDRAPFPVIGVQTADGYFEYRDGMTRQEAEAYAAIADANLIVVRRRDWDRFTVGTVASSLLLLPLVYLLVWTTKIAIRRTVSPFVEFPQAYFLTAIALLLFSLALLRLPFHILANRGVEVPRYVQDTPVILLFVALYVALTIARRRVAPKLRAAAARRCAGCGYDLRGAAGTRCPECGREAASLIFATAPADANAAGSPDASQQNET